jgi:hypothetical protein
MRRKRNEIKRKASKANRKKISIIYQRKLTSIANGESVMWQQSMYIMAKMKIININRSGSAKMAKESIENENSENNGGISVMA